MMQHILGLTNPLQFLSNDFFCLFAVLCYSVHDVENVSILC